MWSTIIMLMAFLDIFKGMNTGFYDKGILIDDKTLIRRHYKNNRLPQDIISTIAVVLNRAYFPGMNINLAYVINILVFAKSYIVMEIIDKIDTIFSI